MKKIMFGLAAAIAMVAAADIVSANVVGYQNKALDAGKFYILGVQFEGMDGTMDINKLVTGVTGVDYDEDGAFVATAPQVQVPKAGGGYDLYYYLNNGYYVDANGNDAEKPGWCDEVGTIAGNAAAGALVSGVLTPGVSAWVKTLGTSEEFTQAGQVAGDATAVVTAPANFALRANIFPIAFNLNDSSKVTFSGLKGVDYDEDGAFVATAPQIQVPKAGGGYDLYYYLNNGYYVDADGNDAEKPGWCDEVGTIAGNVAAGALVSGDVPAGQGFWTKGVGGEFTMTFKK